MGQQGGSAGRLADKVVVISGGARGQGRSHALTFAREGASVVVFDIAEKVPNLVYTANESDLAETERLVKEAGGNILAIKADARDEDAVAGVMQAAVDTFGKIDALCVNHGIAHHGSWDTAKNDWDQMLAINLTGVWLTCRAAIPALIANGGGPSLSRPR